MPNRTPKMPKANGSRKRKSPIWEEELDEEPSIPTVLRHRKAMPDILRAARADLNSYVSRSFKTPRSRSVKVPRPPRQEIESWPLPPPDPEGDVESYPTASVDRGYDPNAAAEKFLSDGYIVLPSAYKSPDRRDGDLHRARPAEMTNLRADIEQEFLSMPEFKTHPTFGQCNEEVGFGCGGSSFLGNPSVYHNPISRRLRAYTSIFLVPFFRSVLRILQERGVGSTQLPAESLMVMARPSRIMVRGRNRLPGEEKWHRDKNPTSQDGEVHIGGWENADNVSEKFIGLKGTHSLDALSSQKNMGFVKIPAGERPKFNAMLKAQANQADTDADGKIIIPPRHFILFFQNIVHAVFGKKGPTSVKHFIGYRITPFNTTGMINPYAEKPKEKTKGKKTVKAPLPAYTFEEIEEKFRKNDVMPMGSGQVATMYPGLYLVNRQNLGFYKRLKNNRLCEGVMAYPDDEHKANDDKTRSMKSLSDCGLPLYPPYTRPELDLMRPGKEFRIFNPDSGHVEEFPLYPPAHAHAPVHAHAETVDLTGDDDDDVVWVPRGFGN